MTITRTQDGFMISHTSTIIATFVTFDGQPEIAFHEVGDPYNTFLATDNAADLPKHAYHAIRHMARWKPEKEWR